MNSAENEEIKKLPDKFRPLGAWTYFWLTILFSIPLVGFICLIVFSVSDSNINRRSFARSFFCGFLIVGGVLLVLVLIAGVNLSFMFQQIIEFFTGVRG